jgi:hypothetical protein
MFNNNRYKTIKSDTLEFLSFPLAQTIIGAYMGQIGVYLNNSMLIISGSMIMAYGFYSTFWYDIKSFVSSKVKRRNKTCLKGK